MNIGPGALFDTVDLTGVLANAILGGAVARELKLDPVGFVVLGIVSGLGGGLLRDTLLQVGFPVAFTNSGYLIFAIAGAAVAFVLPLKGRFARGGLLFADSLALGCWAATGAAKALGAGLGWLPAILLGVLTAVGGGMIRDIVIGRLPVIFGGNTLYATGALIGSAEMTLLMSLGHPTWGMAVSILTTSAISILARWRGWVLPAPGELRLPKRGPGNGQR
ncbi:trimeric intracellular cation channel family protein [Sinomonas susongensis]|uniref:trimeric intracellular cation channel family protein n=1 Tax=Sinomonas susongensis TaxID=1324851 RepID=UPI0011091BF2|nr:TRIC cation channel family protein [Sinomonas susongensis]